MNNKERKATLKKLFGYLLVVSGIILLFGMLYSGQFSFKNRYESTSSNEQAVIRNDEQININEALAEDIEQLITDKNIKIKTSAELGFMERQEKRIRKIIKRIFKNQD